MNGYSNPPGLNGWLEMQRLLPQRISILLI
jgi:hypothetical protein